MIKEFNDLVNFAEEFKTNETRNEIYLNIYDSLVILLNKKTYFYDYKTNNMQFINSTKFNHPNGGFVHIPDYNVIYCISGRKTIEVEKICVYQNELKTGDKWQTVGSISEPRAFFSIFVQNNSKIYLMFGYNFEEEKFFDYFHCLDISSNEFLWTKIFLNLEKIPLMSSCGTLSFSSDNVYIFGGMNPNNEKNNCIYRYNAEENTLEQTELTLKASYDYMNLNSNLQPENLPSTNFVESDFQAFDFHTSYLEHAFYFGCFDSRNFFHLINLKSFSHDLFYLDISVINNNQLTDQDGNQK